MELLFHTTYIGVDLARHEIFRAKVGKGCITDFNILVLSSLAIYVEECPSCCLR